MRYPHSQHASLNQMPSKPLQPGPKSPDPDPLQWHRLLGTTAEPRPSTAQLEGKRILITGAGGSIGSALAHFIATATPNSLILLDTSETALYQVDRDLRATGFAPISILGSIADRPLLADLFHRHHPQLILHTAAYKHVPLVEQNPYAAIANNVLATQTLLEAATSAEAEHLLFVSTDKAVCPRSFMGASKRLAELLCLTQSALRTTSVRLGNVLGSHGSVVPLFLDQIAQTHSLTVTHPAARRFFLTLDQTVHILVEALEPPDPNSSESPQILLAPALTPQVRIVDLARHLLDLHRSPAEIVFTALRPGDKLEESFLAPTERWLDHPRTPSLRAIAGSLPSDSTLASALLSLQASVETRNLFTLLDTVQHLVPGYTPTSELRSQLDPAAATPLSPHEVPTA